MREELIEEKCFNELKRIISCISFDLFVFIHTPNFDGHYNGENLKQQLLSFNNSERNIHIIEFSGGTEYVYEKFIDQNTNELKSIDESSIAQIFEELEAQYGQLTSLNTKLNLLHKCLIPAKVNGFIIDKGWDATQELEALKDAAKKANEDPFHNDYIQALSALRKKLLVSA